MLMKFKDIKDMHIYLNRDNYALTVKDVFTVYTFDVIYVYK